MANAKVRSENDWMAENDANTLARASVLADKNRLSKAKKAAGKMVKEQVQRANAIKKVAASSSPAAPTKKKMVGKKR